MSGALRLNSDGSIDVAANSAADTYTLGYQICEKGNGSNCASATVSVTTFVLAVEVLGWGFSIADRMNA